LLIIDRRLVMTGSANWSENSWGNNENVLWIDDRGIAQAYLLGFERAYARGRAP
jgi:phosphatidylserine/phosphatidylglycerophosphate/cardiolipin synthase-like enzyme